MGDVRTPTSADYDRWTSNIKAWSNWDGTMTLVSDCPIGRKSCVPNSRPPYDDCKYFMGVKGDTDRACCGYLLNKEE